MSHKICAIIFINFYWFNFGRSRAEIQNSNLTKQNPIVVSHLLHWSRQSSPQFILYKRNADRVDINIKIDLHIIISRNAILV